MEENMEGGARPWSRSEGLMGATYMHLSEIGWSAEFEPLHTSHIVCLADSEGNRWRCNNAVSWHDSQETIEEERINQLWAEASKHRGGG